jgi:hypothetical protein
VFGFNIPLREGAAVNTKVITVEPTLTNGQVQQFGENILRLPVTTNYADLAYSIIVALCWH